MFGHNKPDEHVLAAHAEVDGLLQRLGRDITSLDDGGDPVNRQAIADASERFQTAQSQLESAKSVPEILVVRAIAVEGIQATRTVRTRLGLDPGSEPPPAPAPEAPEEHHHSWAQSLSAGGANTGSGLGAGLVGGVLGLLGGEVIGEALGGGGGGYEGGWGGGNGW